MAADLQFIQVNGIFTLWKYRDIPLRQTISWIFKYVFLFHYF